MNDALFESAQRQKNTAKASKLVLRQGSYYYGHNLLTISKTRLAVCGIIRAVLAFSVHRFACGEFSEADHGSLRSLRSPHTPSQLAGARPARANKNAVSRDGSRRWVDLGSRRLQWRGPVYPESGPNADIAACLKRAGHTRTCLDCIGARFRATARALL